MDAEGAAAFAWAPWHPYSVDTEVRLPFNLAPLDANNLLDHDVG
jgi:hypothetical protein